MNEEDKCYMNTDKEIWKQPTTDHGKEDGNDSGMEPSVFVTEQGGVGFNHYGTCAVKTIKDWIGLATRPNDIEDVLKEHQKKFFDYAGYKEQHEWLRENLPGDKGLDVDECERAMLVVFEKNQKATCRDYSKAICSTFSAKPPVGNEPIVCDKDSIGCRQRDWTDEEKKKGLDKFRNGQPTASGIIKELEVLWEATDGDVAVLWEVTEQFIAARFAPKIVKWPEKPRGSSCKLYDDKSLNDYWGGFRNGEKKMLALCIKAHAEGEPIDVERIERKDIECLKSAIRILDDEGYNKDTIQPKKNLLAKLERMCDEINKP